MEWQPIETAPKDKDILLCVQSGITQTILMGGWSNKKQNWEDLREYDASGATHWMPLPGLPEGGV